jgi:hypothetical protein
MRLYTLFCFLLIQGAAQAQLTEPLIFKEKIHDFGEIVESSGSVEYEFSFTNSSGRPVKIISVQASCGCTTPGWSTAPVVAGEKGFIKASFDPKGRPGYFNKTLTVTTDFDRNPIVLQIKGAVVDRQSVTHESLPAVNGNLRLAFNSFNMGKIFINKPSTLKEFAVMNAGTDKIDFVNVVAPGYIKVEKPASLKPGERGLIKLLYDANLRNQYGFLSDNIEIHTTDSVNPVKSFSVYATAEEFFPTLSPEELAKAPALLSSQYEINFDRAKKGTRVENSVALTNKGKQNLEIRYIQSNCACVTVSMEKKSINPGESVQLYWILNTVGRMGTQNKAITIYSNDPRNPVQRITLSGFIED